MKSGVEQILNRCIHFTGVQHEQCNAGIDYESVKDTSASPYRWPCLREKGCVTMCEKAVFPSREEAEQQDREHQKAITEVLKQITNGECPHCHQKVTQRQIGNCVYGSCGHRLYQGKVNPQYQQS